MKKPLMPNIIEGAIPMTNFQTSLSNNEVLALGRESTEDFYDSEYTHYILKVQFKQALIVSYTQYGRLYIYDVTEFKDFVTQRRLHYEGKAQSMKFYSIAY